jgi:MarR-like DNA-binding transcriptional regulator SgrR of sgrS sRNA
MSGTQTRPWQEEWTFYFYQPLLFGDGRSQHTVMVMMNITRHAALPQVTPAGEDFRNCGTKIV